MDPTVHNHHQDILSLVPASPHSPKDNILFHRFVPSTIAESPSTIQERASSIQEVDVLRPGNTGKTSTIDDEGFPQAFLQERSQHNVFFQPYHGQRQTFFVTRATPSPQRCKDKQYLRAWHRSCSVSPQKNSISIVPRGRRGQEEEEKRCFVKLYRW